MDDIRWKQRYANYKKILKLINDSLYDKDPKDFTDLERIGLAKSFELCFELLWKLLKDFLEYEEVEIGIISPKNTIKEAAASGLLEKINADGDILIQTHKSRNELAHIYDYEKFSATLDNIKNLYLPEMIEVDKYFEELVHANE
jgi:nucleotidyltransferase substrate binding protein (TIGR01987 family)